MIPARKFLAQPETARVRKLWRLLGAFEAVLRGQPAGADAPDRAAFAEFASGIGGSSSWLSGLPAGEADRDAGLAGAWDCLMAALADTGSVSATPDGRDALLRAVNGLRHRLGAALGAEAAEWDLFPPVAEGVADAAGHESGLADDPAVSRWTPDALLDQPGSRRIVYCDDIRSPFNLGSVFRSACAFALDGLILSPACPDPAHPRCQRSAMGTIGRLPWARLPEGSDPAGVLDRFAETHGYGLFALELGGTPLADFTFPRRGLAVIGSEELGVAPALLDRCRAGAGVTTIPLSGAKASLNVGVGFGIMAAAWRPA